MSANTLPFKDVHAVPSLRVAELELGSGHAARALSVGPDHVHFVLDGGNEVNFSGPGVAALSINWGHVIQVAIAVGKQIFGGNAGGKAKCTTSTQITFDQFGNIISFSTTTTCTAG
jgi:hypothetical protein